MCRCRIALVVVLFAGCISEAPILAHEEPSATADALAGEGLGGIEGILIDDSLVPVPAATVALDSGAETTSDESGVFRFARLEPATYRLTAMSPTHEPATADVEVLPDQVASVQLTLVPLASNATYFETIPQAGFMACGFGGYILGPPFGNWTFAACGPFAILGLYDLDRFMLDWPEFTPMAPDLVGFFGETTWQSNQALSGELRVYWWLANGPYENVAVNAATWAAYDVGEAVGRSPLNARVNRTTIEENATEIPCNLPEECYLLSGHYPAHRNFNSPIDQTVIFQQRYEDHLTLFHGGELPVEFSVLPDS